MFSLHNFYRILHANLIDPINGDTQSLYFHPFGTYDSTVILEDPQKHEHQKIPGSHYIIQPSKATFFHCYFLDQEPLYESTNSILEKSLMFKPNNLMLKPNRLLVMANSEHSDFKRKFLKRHGMYNWYYFFHGFAALDWYRDFEYLPPQRNFDKVFICFNNLISKNRSYRLHLAANIINEQLVDQGLLSIQLKDAGGSWQQINADPESPIDKRARFKIFTAFKNLSDPLVIDTATPTGALSSEINFKVSTQALFHVVTETMFFDQKLHLTEKIFKPIVCRRPFILAAAPENLAYLKSYGFKTFDRWIDESYDQEQDHYIRIEKITAELKKLCALTPTELKKMSAEMQDVLDYNFHHFYSNFKKTIVNELVDNFDGVLTQINNGRELNNHSSWHRRWELPLGHLDHVKLLLSR